MEPEDLSRPSIRPTGELHVREIRAVTVSPVTLTIVRSQTILFLPPFSPRPGPYHHPPSPDPHSEVLARHVRGTECSSMRCRRKGASPVWLPVSVGRSPVESDRRLSLDIRPASRSAAPPGRTRFPQRTRTWTGRNCPRRVRPRHGVATRDRAGTVATIGLARARLLTAAGHSFRKKMPEIWSSHIGQTCPMHE